MGEARKRGTYEQRKAQAIERDTGIKKLAEYHADIREANMTPLEKRRRHEARLSMAQFMGLAMSVKDEYFR